jgi:hypothetical protein
LLSYEKAFPIGGKMVNSSYEKVEFSMLQQIKLDIFNQLAYHLNTGAFLRKKQMYFPDYRHFNINELFLTNKLLMNSFVLLDNYQWVTNDQWLQVHVVYMSDYLLIKRIPLLPKSLLQEDFHLKTLFLRDVNHSEAGYSIGLGNVGRLGVFAGFDNWKYKNIGFVISLPITNIF